MRAIGTEVSNAASATVASAHKPIIHAGIIFHAFTFVEGGSYVRSCWDRTWSCSSAHKRQLANAYYQGSRSEGSAPGQGGRGVFAVKRCHRYAAEFLQRRVSTKTQQKHKDATFRNKGRDVNLNSTVLGGKSSKCMHNFKKITRRFPKWCLSAAKGSKNMIFEQSGCRK